MSVNTTKHSELENKYYNLYPECVSLMLILGSFKSSWLLQHNIVNDFIENYKITVILKEVKYDP
jgi:hypothetical protein